MNHTRLFKLTLEASLLAGALFAHGCGNGAATTNPTETPTTATSTTSAAVPPVTPPPGTPSGPSATSASVGPSVNPPVNPTPVDPPAPTPGTSATTTPTTTPSGTSAVTGTDPTSEMSGSPTTEAGQTSAPTDGLEWLPSWGTTIQRTEVKNLPNNGADPKTSWTDKTVRQFIWPTFSGEEIRIRLNNEKGESPLEVKKLHIAKAKTAADPGTSGGQVDVTTDTALTFGGMPGVTVPAGMAVWSDPVEFPLTEIQLTAISMQLGASVPTGITGHPGARTTTYFANGDAVSSEALTGATTIDRWYFIETLEVMAPKDAYAIAAFGDSITDGYGILNKFERWPDYLTLRVKADPVLGPKRSVVNFGMGANNLTKDSTDESNASIVTQDSGLKRFDHDVITSTKIKWVVIFEGVNDMTYSDVNGDALNAAYSSMIVKAHDKGILAYGATILPCDSGLCPAQRTVVNDWIKTSGEYDAALDFAGVVSTSENVWNNTYKNDALHPNTNGYKALADSIELSLFSEVMP